MKLSLMLIKHRMLFACSIVCVIAVSIVVNISSSILTQSVLQYKWDRGTSSYGNFSCGISNISKEEEKIVLQNFCEENIGKFETYQNVEYDDLMITLGYADEAFCNMTGIKLISGRFPLNSNEIVVENFVANMLDESGILEIEHNNEKIQLKIVGIIGNYSSRLLVPVDESKIGNVYPNVICNENNFLQSETTVRSLLINMEGVVDTKKDYIKNTEHIYTAVEEAGLTTSDIYINDNLLNKGLAGCKEIWHYSLFFSFVVTVITAAFSYVILNIFYKDYREKLSILNVCGREFAKLLTIVKQQLFFFFIIANALGILLGYGIINVFRICFNITVSYKSGITIAFLFWTEINLFCVILLVLMKCKMEITQYSLAENLRCKSDISNAARIKEKSVNRNILKRIRSASMTYTLLFVAVFIVMYFSLYIWGITIYGNPNIPDYQLFSKEVEEVEVVNGFTVESSTEKYILENDIRKLQRYSPYIIYDLWPDFNSYTILFEKNAIPDYFETWNSMYPNQDTSYDGSIIEKNWPEEFDNLIPVNNVDFIVADNALLKDIVQRYELTTPISQLRDETDIILFLPENIQHKSAFIEGNTIKIGGISQYGNQVIGKQFTFNIAEIVNKPYQIETDYTLQQRDNVIVFLSEEAAKKSNLFQGYRSVSVRFKADVPEHITNDIDNLMYEMANKIQGGVLYSKEEILMDEQIFTTYNKILSTILMTINILFGSIMVTIMVYQTIKKNIRTYGILRVLGLSFEKNIFYVWESYIKSVFISYILDAVFTLIILGNVEIWLYYLTNFIIALGQTVILLFIICFITYVFLSKMKMKDMIVDG